MSSPCLKTGTPARFSVKSANAAGKPTTTDRTDPLPSRVGPPRRSPPRITVSIATSFAALVVSRLVVAEHPLGRQRVDLRV
ncbi:hypothetical protein SAMN04488066_103189 [Halorubrum aquaticum]|uniref:Uncharacterized protein n=1 Tax=Halorubrum aquaticum TaxID=387340 RepID=A0A1I2ZVX3_9EURY|nr:hypothetical protein SAMN04488066_103189 [Halorubrum aquaticum]